MKQELIRAYKILLTLFARVCLRVFYVFPIKKNRVLFECYREKQYGCNPKYISEKLKELYGDEIEIGWSFRKPENFKYLEETGIKVLKAQTIECFKFALTAHVICMNTYYKPMMPRRRGQYFIRTWHGGGAYKKVGKLQKMTYLQRKFLSFQEQGADLYISSSEAFTRLTLRESFGYEGEVLEVGMPRNDILINGKSGVSENVKAALGIDKNKKLALYAPTYRDDVYMSDIVPDYSRALKALEKRFGGEWEMAYRGHHVVMYFDKGELAKGAVDATMYPDMQELLLAADCLITDYSSCIWDMSFTGKPVFLYAPDLKKYSADRDFFTDIHSWPFPLSESDQELENIILNFDNDKYLKDIDNHHRELGSFESGHASEAVAKRIYDICRGGAKK